MLLICSRVDRYDDERGEIELREKRVFADVGARGQVRPATAAVPIAQRQAVEDDGVDDGTVAGRRGHRGQGRRLVADLGFPAERGQKLEDQRHLQRDHRDAVHRPGLSRVHDRHDTHAVQHVQVQTGRRTTVVQEAKEVGGETTQANEFRDQQAVQPSRFGHQFEIDLTTFSERKLSYYKR